LRSLDGEEKGQTTDRQINNLADVQQIKLCAPAVDGDPKCPSGLLGDYVNVVNGYVLADNSQLRLLNSLLGDLGAPALNAIRRSLRVGRQQGTQVTSQNWGVEMVVEPDAQEPGQLIDQVFCSAVAVSYSGNPRDLWKPFAQLVLEGLYEATLLIGVLAQARCPTKEHKVYLTAVGGGAFGNPLAWIAECMENAIQRVNSLQVGLDVRVVSYGVVPQEFVELAGRHQRQSSVTEEPTNEPEEPARKQIRKNDEIGATNSLSDANLRPS